MGFAQQCPHSPLCTKIPPTFKTPTVPVLSSGKKLDVASHFSYILKRLYLSLLRVGMFKEATTAPFCKWLQKRGFISRPSTEEVLTDGSAAKIRPRHSSVPALGSRLEEDPRDFGRTEGDH
jgi:hypothetical protein